MDWNIDRVSSWNRLIRTNSLDHDVLQQMQETIENQSHQRKLEDRRAARSPLSKNGDTTTTVYHCKCYMCFFTCVVTRAVPLELVPDLSTRSYLLAFRRFATRRGPILVMYSDNAQAFRCVSRHLNILQADPSVKDFLARRNLLWIFSASLAPWWGGFRERMVRSVKDLLRRSNGIACLAYDELEASVINARPLNYIGEGADDPLPITPNQFS